MNKADKIRAAAPGLDDEAIARLARGTVAEVDGLVRRMATTTKDS